MRSEDVLSTIKTESIQAVYRTLLTRGELSRADVAELTGLSLMTTCKICDALIDCGFFRQEKDSHQKSGRKASLITINPQRYCLLLTRTQDQLSAELTDMTLRFWGRLNHPDSDLSSALPFFLLTIFTEWADRLDSIDGIVYFIDQFPPETDESIAQIFPNVPIYPLTQAETIYAALRSTPNTLLFAPETMGLFYIGKSGALPLHPEAFFSADTSPSKISSTLAKLTVLFGAANLILERPSPSLAAHMPHARIFSGELSLQTAGCTEIVRKCRLEHLLERVKP